jgi:hypothetical protein
MIICPFLASHFATHIFPVDELLKPWPPRSKKTKSLITPVALAISFRQHIKGLGGLPIFSNITLNNGQCKVMAGRIVGMYLIIFNGHPIDNDIPNSSPLYFSIMQAYSRRPILRNKKYLSTY